MRSRFWNPQKHGVEYTNDNDHRVIRPYKEHLPAMIFASTRYPWRHAVQLLPGPISSPSPSSSVPST